MYKRRFAVPLHKPQNGGDHAQAAAAGMPSGAAAAAPAAPTSASGVAAPAAAQPDQGQQQQQQERRLEESRAELLAMFRGDAGATGGKENSARPPLAPPALKRPKLFAPPPLEARVFSVLYTKRAKFAKRSDKGFQDGIFELRNKSGTLLDMEGKVITKGKPKLPPELESGAIIELGNFCCEIDQDIDVQDFRSGVCFTDALQQSSAPMASLALPCKQTVRGGGGGSGGGSCPGGGRPGGVLGRPGQPAGAAAPSAGAPPPAATAPLFDPGAPGALVLNASEWRGGQGRLPGSGCPVVPVVVDPYVGRHLRPHQREGVAFLYECLMGLRSDKHLGCLLADEMGLGKTLQVIALLWTLLRQGPSGAPIARKAIVVAPATLVANWGKEVKKWLGTERLGYILLQQGPEAASKVNDFKLGTVWKLLISSYETLRKHTEALAGCCDVLVCDEGHRLKAVQGNKTISSLLQLGCQRRIVLTGTPLQNNLQELHALLTFAAGDVLGTSAQFKRIYGDPITRSRDKDCSLQERELGEARAEELQRQTSTFVLRRTQAVLSKHLPPLAVHTVFCRPSPLQLEVYRGLLRSKRLSTLIYGGGGGGGDEGVLPAITLLRKVCNHPKLLLQEGSGKQAGQVAPAGGGAQQQQQQQEQQQQGSGRLADVAAVLLQAQLEATGLRAGDVQLSGKLVALEALLAAAIAEGCKAVVVSTSTSALDLVDSLLCGPRGWRSVRIDGGTSVDERQTIVDNFNSRGVGQVFLLSTRAGGAGLNLIGANHLVLYDSDWNPAMDKQAMARIWRDGQRRPCFVHRLLTTGTIEEKVYQRQIMKADLASAMQSGGGAGAGVAGLSHSELKQLFSLEPAGATCATRGLLESCGAGGGVCWLELPGAGAGGAERGAGLPSVLAAAVAVGAVSDINKELQASEQQQEQQQQEQQQEQQQGGGVGEAGGGGSPGDEDGGSDSGGWAPAPAGGRLRRRAAAAPCIDDVDELELEDD